MPNKCRQRLSQPCGQVLYFRDVSAGEWSTLHGLWHAHPGKRLLGQYFFHKMQSALTHHSCITNSLFTVFLSCEANFRGLGANFADFPGSKKLPWFLCLDEWNVVDLQLKPLKYIVGSETCTDWNFYSAPSTPKQSFETSAQETWTPLFHLRITPDPKLHHVFQQQLILHSLSYKCTWQCGKFNHRWSDLALQWKSFFQYPANRILRSVRKALLEQHLSVKAFDITWIALYFTLNEQS